MIESRMKIGLNLKFKNIRVVFKNTEETYASDPENNTGIPWTFPIPKSVVADGTVPSIQIR